MRKTIMKRIIVAALVSVSASASAQTAQECQAGIDSLAAGARNPRYWSYIGGCGNAGMAAIATRLSGSAGETDTLYLDALMATASDVRDSAVFRAARTLVANGGATVASRLAGLNVLASQRTPGMDFILTIGWAASLATPRGNDCHLGGGTYIYGHETALPSDYLGQMAATLDTVSYLRPSENAIVRDAATCVRLLIRNQVPLTVPASAITLTYVCGTTFTASNSSNRVASLQFRLKDTTDTRALTIPAGGSRSFFTPRSGVVEVLQNNVVIASAKNSGKACP
jgi:hypothetical protein